MGEARGTTASIGGRMFDALSDRFDGIFKRLRGKGRLRDEDVDDVLREIRVALLEADVNFSVVRSMLGRIREQAVGADLSAALNPAEQVIKIVHQELINTLGGTTGKLAMNPKPPTVVMLVGLQGSGKTTTAGKLAKRLKLEQKAPFLVAAITTWAGVEPLFANRMNSSKNEPVEPSAKNHEVAGVATPAAAWPAPNG